MEVMAEERKAYATELQRRLGIKPLSKQSPTVTAKIKEIETKHECTVYAVTHELMTFGECYSFLMVPRYQEDWEQIVIPGRGGYRVYAYVWNLDADECSEFGFIDVIVVDGKPVRVA